MLPTIIQDPLGLETGIKITNVRSVLDRDCDRILISGRMYSDRIVGLDIEPDLQCEIVNAKDQICLSVCSVHQGVFSVTRNVMFTLLIEEVSRSIDWEDIERINLYAIFRSAF